MIELSDDLPQCSYLILDIPSIRLTFARLLPSPLDPPAVRLNPKNTGSTYLKSDANTLWARNAARRAKEPAPVTEVRTFLYSPHAESDHVPPHPREDEDRT